MMLRRVSGWRVFKRAFGDSIHFSRRMEQKSIRRSVPALLDSIDLVVCDMAGTVVQEGGVVYHVLQRVMNEDGIHVSTSDMKAWHGAKKEEVLGHFVVSSGTPVADIDARVERLADKFLEQISTAYFETDAPVKLIDPTLLEYIRALQAAGIKVTLNSGYPQNIQRQLVTLLGFQDAVDSYISAYEVPAGRPYPFMIHRLMERHNIASVKRVCKVGDSVRDIEEGKNAGCGLVVGVLSGADDAETLLKAGADVIANRVTDLPIPRSAVRNYSAWPDLS